jgi:hypothetical protein
LAIQSGDCPLEVFAFRQLDKTESARSSRQPVANHYRRRDLKAGVNHKFVELSIADAVR